MGALTALPALDLKTPEQPDLLSKYAQLQQLRASQQAMQIRAQQAPLQQQQLEQGVQSGGLQIQQQQQQIRNTQALTTAYQNWNPTKQSYDDLAQAALKAGADGTVVQALQQHALALKKTASDIAEADAKTGSDNATTLGKQLDQAAGELQGVLQAPPEQQGQLLISTAQQLAQQKRPDGTPLLDQQHLQMAQQLAQQGPQAIAQAVPVYAKSLTALSAQLEAAQKEAATAADAAKLKQTQAETAYYQANGGAPGVPGETVERNAWLAANPGKNPSDYVAWKARQSPMALVMGNQLGGGQGGQQGNPALDLVANNYLKTGQMPPEMTRSPGTITAVIQRAAQIAAQNGNTDLASNTADFKANQASLHKLQTNFDQVQAFEKTATSNLDLYLNTLSKIPDLGVKFANVPMRMINDKMIGTANYQAMKAAQQTASAEVAKVLSSANATGVLSDTQKRDAEDVLSGNLSYPAAQKVIETLKQDMANRTQSYQAQIGDIQGRIKGSGSQPSIPQGTSVGTTNKPDGVYQMNGKQYTVKSGQVYE